MWCLFTVLRNVAANTTLDKNNIACAGVVYALCAAKTYLKNACGVIKNNHMSVHKWQVYKCNAKISFKNFDFMSATDDYFKLKDGLLTERIREPTHEHYAHAQWTRVWKIGDFETNGLVRIVDKRAQLTGPEYNSCPPVEVYGEIATIIAIIAPTDALPFTEGGEAVVCLLELSNPDAEKNQYILDTQIDNLEQLPRSAEEIQDGAPPPLYRNDRKYLCVLLQNLQLHTDYVQHATPLLSTSSGFECVRGHDGFDYDGESSQYRLAFERNGFRIEDGYEAFDKDNCGFDMSEYMPQLYKDWCGNPIY